MIGSEDTRKVRRWDVYDVADQLADVGPALRRALQSGDFDEVLDISALADDLANNLWAASVRGGSIGPFPFYEEV
jgi:hypothetical protein